ncbi:MAG TPA: rhodanese-like domain-containing protein [Cyclobacteriaceae bacterium]
MNARIVLSIIIIGLGATAAMLPDARNNALELNEKALHQEILKSSHYITADELAGLLINEDPSVQLIDVRTGTRPDDLLPGALHIPVDSIFSPNKNFYFDQIAMKNILYSDDDQLATQVWMITRQKGYKNNYILSGGLEAWNNLIINPKYPDNSAPKSAFDLYEKRAAASRYFTGSEKTIKPAKINPIIPIQRKKKKKVQGGCS